jgi:hypothetical protein
MDYHKNYYIENKQKYIDYYQQNKELKKAYYIQNRDKIIEQVKEYNMKNKIKIRSYNIKYYEIHKRELLQKQKIIHDHGKLYYDNCIKKV